MAPNDFQWLWAIESLGQDSMAQNYPFSLMDLWANTKLDETGHGAPRTPDFPCGTADFANKVGTKWPQAFNTTFWAQFDKGAHKVLEEPVKVHVDWLQAILTIVISLAKKKSGGEKSSQTRTLPNSKPKTNMICRIQQELKSFKKHLWKSSGPSWKMQMTLHSAQWYRMWQKKEGQEACFIHSQSIGFSKLLLHLKQRRS